MVRFLANLVLSVIGNAIGLVLAGLLLEGFHLSVSGFIYSVVFFTIAYTILSPFVLKMALRYVPALSGGIALVTVLIVLVLTSVFTQAIRIDNLTAWVVAPLIIWVATIVAGVVLPLFVFKKALGNVRQNNADNAAATAAAAKKG